MSHFPSHRTIGQRAREIWRVEPQSVERHQDML